MSCLPAASRPSPRPCSELVSDLFSLYKTRIWMQQVDTSSIPGEEIALRLAHAAGFLPSSYMLEASRDMEELSQTVSEFAAGGGGGHYYEGADAAGGLVLTGGTGGASYSPSAVPSAVRGMGPSQYPEAARLSYVGEDDRRATHQHQQHQQMAPQQQIRYVSTPQSHGYPAPASARGAVHHSAFGFAAPFHLHGEEPSPDGTPRVTELDSSRCSDGPATALGFDVERTMGPLLESPGGVNGSGEGADADEDEDTDTDATAAAGADVGGVGSFTGDNRGGDDAFGGASEELKTFTEAA